MTDQPKPEASELVKRMRGVVEIVRAGGPALAISDALWVQGTLADLEDREKCLEELVELKDKEQHNLEARLETAEARIMQLAESRAELVEQRNALQREVEYLREIEKTARIFIKLQGVRLYKPVEGANLCTALNQFTASSQGETLPGAKHALPKGHPDK